MPFTISREEIIDYNARFEGKTPEELLGFFLNKLGNRVVFASSLGAEDQVLTHMLAGIDKQANIFTLDTGRLFPETLDLIDKTNKRYGIGIKVYFPDAGMVESMVNEKGINLFYESVKNRIQCCNIRKIVPMKRALEGATAWISGLRNEQSVTRKNIDLVDWDEKFGLIKISPLIHWTEKQVWDYIGQHKVPYNKLHDAGYPSIGCQPCTRPVTPGDDIRAGRWWWEQPELKECGLHKKEN
jgi:phosphoadenosine phosphosulfate reductase